MILTSGMSTTVALNLIERTKQTQLDLVAAEPVNSRAIEAFKERIGSITTVDELVDDYEVYSFVMKAFDLEDQIFGKALTKQLLSEDSEDSSALVNKLTDSRFTELYESLGFVDGVTENTLDSDWQQEMIDRYIEQQFINETAEDNEDLGAVLEFQQKVGDVSNWYDILKDEDLANFIRTALGLSDAIASADIDRQAALFEERIGLENLQDPDYQERLIRQFVAFSDAQAIADGETTNPIVELMQSSSSSDFVMVTIDMDLIQGFSASAYR